MSLNRVQKLLFSEYCDFEDMVLIESPFAQTTREGRGVRQVHLGLTPTKLVLATDVLPPVEKSSVTFIPGIDPDIETFELIAVYPVECVNLSVFRRRKRQTIKAHFCNNRVFYFELGGFEKRNMFWNLWCEKVKFLCPEYSGSSHSETSVATSSTNSTLYLVNSKQVVKPNGLKQLWCKFGTGKSRSSLVRKWTDRSLYLGKNYEDLPLNYRPAMLSPQISQFMKPKPNSSYCLSSTKTVTSLAKEIRIGDSIHINRFGSGVREGCSTGLFLPAEDYIVQRRFSQTTDLESSGLYTASNTSNNYLDFDELAESCVKLWELYKETDPNRYPRHKRRYGFAPQPLFLHGLGPWNVAPGARYSVQVKRAVSSVTIRRQPAEPEMRLPVAKRQLVATVSCETLIRDHERSITTSNTPYRYSPKRPVIFFWTPDYWYRPRSARDAYNELQLHLNNIREYRRKLKKPTKKRLFRKRFTQKIESSDSETDFEALSGRFKKSKKRKSMMRFNVFGAKTNDIDREKKCQETSLQFLKRILKIDSVLTAWDFDSTTIAQQLTMIDRDLFLKVSPLELRVLVWQQTSKNAPNVAAIVAFSHRISCLVASDILRNDNEKTRARLIARFVNVAYKCHKISNFHSCRTVLFGLQCPAIYRLRSTWAYVRKKHASKYLMFEFLCRLYRDPRLAFYQKAFYLSSQNSPYLPFIGDAIAKLLNRIPDYRIGKMPKGYSDDESLSRPHQSETTKLNSKQSNVFTKLLASIKLLRFDEGDLGEQQLGTANHEPKSLCHYFKPLNCYEDNRIKCLADTVEFLQQCQLSCLQYCFITNNLALDYLLKARYKEERENFYHSFRVESLQCSKWHLHDT